jgi:hypothetical protein
MIMKNYVHRNYEKLRINTQNWRTKVGLPFLDTLYLLVDIG